MKSKSIILTAILTALPSVLMAGYYQTKVGYYQTKAGYCKIRNP